MKREKRLEIGRHLEQLGFAPAPDGWEYSSGCVCPDDPDGVYFNVRTSDDAIQILIVGKTDIGPDDFAAKIGMGYAVESHGLLQISPNVSAEARRSIIKRGFRSIILNVGLG